MGEFVTGVIQTQLDGKLPGMEKQQLQQTQKGGSFESVLQKNNSQTAPNADNQTVNQINNPKLETMRQDLMQRYQTLPEGVPNVSAIFPEYLNTKTQMSDFRNILNKAVNSVSGSPLEPGVKGRFTQVEDEWLKLENIMRSDKELSQGELLGLQARLYQVSQHIEVLSKVIDQMSSGVKTILNTNI